MAFRGRDGRRDEGREALDRALNSFARRNPQPNPTVVPNYPPPSLVPSFNDAQMYVKVGPNERTVSLKPVGPTFEIGDDTSEESGGSPKSGLAHLPQAQWVQLSRCSTLPRGQKVTVQLAHYNHPGDFYVLPQKAASLLSAMLSNLNAYIVSKRMPAPGEKFLLRGTDSAWIRVEVEAMRKNGRLEVIELDSGKVCHVDGAQRIEMPEELKLIPPLAIHVACDLEVADPGLLELHLREEAFDVSRVDEEEDRFWVTITRNDRPLQLGNKLECDPNSPNSGPGSQRSMTPDASHQRRDETIDPKPREATVGLMSDRLRSMALSAENSFSLPHISPGPVINRPVNEDPTLPNSSVRRLNRNNDSFLIADAEIPSHSRVKEKEVQIPVETYVSVHIEAVKDFNSIWVNFAGTSFEGQVYGLKPAKGQSTHDIKWQSEAHKLLSMLLLDPEAVDCWEVRQVPTSCAQGPMELDLMLYGDNLLDLLQDLSSSVFDSSASELTMDNLPTESFADFQGGFFTFSCVSDETDLIYVQVEKKTRSLDQMNKAIAQSHKMKPLEKASIKAGLLVLARHDGKLYRAMIKSWYDKETVLALFIDYGNANIFSPEELVQMPEEFGAYAPFSLLVQLHWVEKRPMSDAEKVTSLKLFHGSNSRLKLHLWRMNGEGIPVVSPRSRQNRHLLTEYKNIVLPIKSSIHNRDEDLDEAVMKEQIRGIVTRVSEDGFSFFFVQDESIPLLTEISSRLGAYYSSHHDNQDDFVPSLSEIVCVRNKNDTFSRAVVKEILEDCVKCFFIDYGVENVFKVAQVYPLISNVEDYPKLAHRCMLDDESEDYIMNIKAQRYALDVKECLEGTHVVNIVEELSK